MAMPDSQNLPLDVLSKIAVARFRRARDWRGSQRVMGKSVDEWLRLTHNAYHKIHEREELNQFPGMKAYFGLTQLKINAAVSRMKNTYAHAIDAPFVLSPSAFPELPKEKKTLVLSRVKSALNERMNQFALTPGDLKSDGQLLPGVQDFIRKQHAQVFALVNEEERKVAKTAAAYHAQYLRKQMLDGNWSTVAPLMFFDLMLKPYTVVCAGELMPIGDLSWSGNKAVFKTELRPTWRHIPAEMAYIGSDATSAQDGEGFSEQVPRSYRDIVNLMGLKNPDGSGVYIESQLRKVIEHYDTSSIDWLGLGQDTAEASFSREKRWSSSPSSKMMAIVHQGCFSAKELSDAGITGYGDDAAEIIEMTVEVIGSITVRYSINPVGRRNYYSATYKNVGDTYAGISIGMMLQDTQQQVNWMMFAKNRNLWHSSGPTAVVNGAFFSHAEDARLSPFSKLYADPKRDATATWAIQQHHVNPMFQGIRGEMRQLLVDADEQCGVPSLFSGMSRGGVSRTTLGGTVIEQTNGEAGLNDATINLDKGIVEPMTKAQLFWNMQHLPNVKHIRGDIEIEGRGIFALKERELKQRLLASSLPVMAQGVQQQLLPTQMLQDAYKQYFDEQGIDTSAMQSGQARDELNSFGLNPPVTNDARTFSPQQSTLGVAQ